ncbi:MAG: GNAT family N-acetyltransferase [Pseudomonadota bacterium]
MSTAAPLPLKFQVGARTLLSVHRTLHRTPLSLADALDRRLPALPLLGPGVDGYALTSLPADLEPHLRAAAPGMIAFVRQRYTRYFTDLGIGADAWWSGLSGNTRSGLKRKAKKAGALTVHRYRTPDELAAFHRVARGIAATTYQERLLGAGLPDTPEFVARMLGDAAADSVRAWTLDLGGVPAAYLYCPVRGSDVIYEYVGHDPAFGDLSVGTLLHVEAMRDLLDEGRFARFDFTEGEGQHKRTLSTGGVACVDLLLLKPTLANRAAVAGLAGFDRAVALAKAAVARAGAGDWVRRVRRG